MVTRWCKDFKVLLLSPFVLTTAIAAETGATQSSSDLSREQSNHTISQQYLQPQAKWPALHANAHADVAALPAPLKVDTTLAAIGQRLFHDPKLSRDATISCASCHKADHHFADKVRISPGVAGREGNRTSQMLRLVGHWDTLFWDGRVNELTALVEQPLTHPKEMDSSIEHVMAYLATEPSYQAALADYFQAPLAWEHVAKAIAEFMRSVENPPRRFDHFMRAITVGNSEQAAEFLTEQERLGLHLFRTKAGCVQCHSGALFSDQRLHNIGLTYYGRRFEDLGHFKISGKPEHVGAFRTPSLRYVTERKYLMHNGLFDDLLGIVRMYQHGGARPKPRPEQENDPLFPETSALLVPFRLSKDEEYALLSFLGTL